MNRNRVLVDSIQLEIDAVEEIKKQIQEFEKGISQIGKINDIKRYAGKIDEWLQRKKVIDNQLIQFYNGQKKTTAFDRDLINNNIALRDSKSLNNISNIKDNLTTILTDGYRLLHQIRDEIMEPITYQIFYKEKGVIHERTVGMETLLKNITLAVENAELKISETKKITGEDISKFYKLKINSLTEIANEDMGENNNDKIVNGAFYNYLVEKESQEPWFEKTTNKGYIYEAYNYLTTKTNGKFSPDVVPKRKLKIIRVAMLTARRNTVAGWKGGDDANKQLKNTVDTSASVITLGSLDIVMKKLSNALKLSDDELVAELKDTFVQDLNKEKERINKHINEVEGKKIQDMLRRTLERAIS